MMSPLVGLIASKNPHPSLVRTVKSLFKGGCNAVIVVNDGSDSANSQEVFAAAAEAGAEIIHLPKNVGKARALQAGFELIPHHAIIMQTDDDTIAGDLSGSEMIIFSGEADIVDIRVDVARTHSMLGLAQEVNFWFIGAIKIFQDMFRARTWASGASLMYSHKAGQTLIMQQSTSMTEDTEGLFRAHKDHLRIRYDRSRKSRFLTMVPEDIPGLAKQWRRWATGNVQVMMKHGLGGGRHLVAISNAITWLVLVAPGAGIIYGLLHTEHDLGHLATAVLWGLSTSLIVSLLGAVFLRRPKLVFATFFLPVIALLWSLLAFAGIWYALRLRSSGAERHMAWESPKRTDALEGLDD